MLFLLESELGAEIKRQIRGIDSLGLRVTTRENLASFCYFVFLLLFFLSTESVLLACWKQTNILLIPLSVFNSSSYLSELWEEKMKRNECDKCVFSRLLKLEPHGLAFSGMIKFFFVPAFFIYRQNTRAQTTNNPTGAPKAKMKKKKKFSQPEAGLQGYMLYLIHWTPHRPDAGRILLMSWVARCECVWVQTHVCVHPLPSSHS